jgi:hypothetical protein
MAPTWCVAAKVQRPEGRPGARTRSPSPQRPLDAPQPGGDDGRVGIGRSRHRSHGRAQDLAARPVRLGAVVAEDGQRLAVPARQALDSARRIEGQGGGEHEIAHGADDLVSGELEPDLAIVHRDAAAVHTLHRRDQARATGSHARVRRRSQALPAVEPRAIPALWNGGKRGPPAQAMIALRRWTFTPRRSTSARRTLSASRALFASCQR